MSQYPSTVIMKCSKINEMGFKIGMITKCQRVYYSSNSSMIIKVSKPSHTEKV